MEGANESGRTAVNALLDAAGSNAERAATFKLYRDPLMAQVQSTDEVLYRAGLPNALDHPVPGRA